MPSETILAGLIGSEDHGEYGVVLTAAAQCIVFETGPEGSLTRWEHVEDITTLETLSKQSQSAFRCRGAA